jgi:uncharacterized protein (TIGR02722 family)
MKNLALLLAVLVMIAAAGCATTVKRVDTDTVIDLSGDWNDTDSRLVAEEMVKDALNRPWVDNFSQKHHGKQPVVIVGTVVNRSHEHINTQTFTDDLQRELTNSGRVFFVAGKGERDEVREERSDQLQNATEETAHAPGKETGADYMLRGTINTILDEKGSTKVIFYQVDLEMVDMGNNMKVWLGQKKIKKVKSRGSVTY